MKEDIIKKFEKIYNDESDSIFRFCLMRVSDREQALDITQETFLRLWKILIEDKKVDNSRAFLFTIARHLIIDWYRKKKSLSLDKMLDNESEFNSDLLDAKTIDNLEIGPEGRYLMEKINDLTSVNRQAIYLRFVEDLSPPEIGEILGISANTASVRINRGLIELRKMTGYDKNE